MRETATSVLSQAPVCSVLHHPAHITFTKLPCFTYEADHWRLWMIASTSQMYAVSNFLYSFYSLVCWADFLTDCLIDGYSKGTFMSPINNPLKVFLFFFPPKVPLNQFSKQWSLPHLSVCLLIELYLLCSEHNWHSSAAAGTPGIQHFSVCWDWPCWALLCALFSKA